MISFKQMKKTQTHTQRWRQTLQKTFDIRQCLGLRKKNPTSSVLICHVSFVPLGLHRVMNNMVPKTLCIYFQPENKPVAIHTFIHNKLKKNQLPHFSFILACTPN